MSLNPPDVMPLRHDMAQFEHIFEKNCFGHLATILPDGSPHAAPLWVIYDKENFHFVISVEEGSIKEKNISRDERVCLSVTDPDNPYHYVQIRGTVVKKELDEEERLLNKLYNKYSNGKHEKYWSKYESRILNLTIEPMKITGWGKESAGDFFSTLLDNS